MNVVEVNNIIVTKQSKSANSQCILHISKPPEDSFFSVLTAAWYTQSDKAQHHGVPSHHSNTATPQPPPHITQVTPKPAITVFWLLPSMVPHITQSLPGNGYNPWLRF